MRTADPETATQIIMDGMRHNPYASPNVINDDLAEPIARIDGLTVQRYSVAALRIRINGQTVYFEGDRSRWLGG